ncbi:MAG: patatin-like phospholipase family protein [Acidovorax sp.]|uniref:patatin-like phospholipase family protein n=1 Tax=Acidovorax sp. TaxID=1872122 RepID=UPI003918893C
MVHGIAVLASFVWLAGCTAMSASPSKPEPKHDLGNPQNVEDGLFAAERAHLSSAKKPKVGLALAGGGTKAAAFAHGVLHGLHDAGVLQHVDVISSVSGGSYAAMWYFTKQIEAKRHNFDAKEIFLDCWPAWRIYPLVDSTKKDWPEYKHLFDAAAKKEVSVCANGTHNVAGDPYRFQAHLVRYPDLFRTAYTAQTSNKQSAPVGESLGLLANTMFELLVGWMGINTGLVDAYQAGIERTWGLNPERRQFGAPDRQEAWSYTNDNKDSQAYYLPRMDGTTATFAQLRELYKNDTAPPMWVLQSTLGNKGKLPNMETLYEISPFIQGSPNKLAPYESSPEKFAPEIQQIPKAVRASAAFADSQGVQPGILKSLMVGISNHLLPSSRWGVDIKLKNGKPARLSDGGGADNLGLMSLVRRRLSDIIIADSAQDKRGTMHDLCWAQKALEQERLVMKFENLQHFDEICKFQFPPAGDGKNLAYNVSMWLNPVVRGTITSEDTGQRTNLWLIKPGWNQQEIREAYNDKALECQTKPTSLPCGLILHYANNTEYKTPEGDYMDFPQDGTASSVLNFSSYKITAYRELGRYNAGYLKFDDQKIVLGRPEQLQIAHPNDKVRPGPSIPAMNGD